MNPNSLQSEFEKDLGYRELFAILLRRRFWLGWVFFGVLSVTAIVTLITKPTYESKIQLLVEPNHLEKETLEGENQKTQTDKEDYATQLILMQSSQFAEKAANLLRSEYPTIEGKDIEAHFNLFQVEEHNTNTRIFEAVYSDSDPIKTQKVLEAMQKAYQDYNLEQNNLRLTQGLDFINKELPVVYEKFIQAEGALKEFREREHIIDPEKQAAAITEELNSFKQEQLAIRAQYQDTQARYTDLQQQLALSPHDALISSHLSESSRYQALLNELQNTELTLAKNRLTYTDASPNVQKLLEQRQSHLALLQEEMGRVLGNVLGQLNLTEEELLEQGQLGDTELALVAKLIETHTELVGLQAREQSLAETEQKLRAELDRFPSLIAEYDRLQPEAEIERETIKQLLEARQELSLELARGGFNWQVVEAPQLGKKISPSFKKNLLLGIVVGLFLGGIAAFGREALDDAVHTSDELKQKLALPLLGIIPELPQAKASNSIINLSLRKPQIAETSIVETVNWLPFRESLDLIYQNIQLLNSASSLKSLAVTSALAGEGKSSLVLGLALSAARLNQRVLIIDADLRRPTLHKQLNIPNEQGLSNLLSGKINLPNLYNISSSGSNIDIFTAGPTPDDPVKLLSSQRMRELIAAFEQNYDLVLVDTSPIIGMADALKAASCCSGVVMVGRIDRVTQAELAEATVMLNKLNVVGVVANGARSLNKNYAAYVEQNGSPSVQQDRPLIEEQGASRN